MLIFMSLRKTVAQDIKRLDGILTLDPGLTNTGYAHWHSDSTPTAGSKPPINSGVWITNSVPWLEAVSQQVQNLHDFLVWSKCRLVVIEAVEFWDSARSEAMARRGGLLQLSALIGALAMEAKAETYALPVLVLAREWKGQLKDHTVKDRVERTLGVRYRTHEADAVGIGLALQGRL